MSHSTHLESGNVIHHNGGWDGPLDFVQKPVLADLAEVLALSTEQALVSAVEDEMHSWYPNLASEAAALRALAVLYRDWGDEGLEP